MKLTIFGLDITLKLCSESFYWIERFIVSIKFNMPTKGNLSNEQSAFPNTGTRHAKSAFFYIFPKCFTYDPGIIHKTTTIILAICFHTHSVIFKIVYHNDTKPRTIRFVEPPVLENVLNTRW